MRDTETEMRHRDENETYRDKNERNRDEKKIILQREWITQLSETKLHRNKEFHKETYIDRAGKEGMI